MITSLFQKVLNTLKTDLTTLLQLNMDSKTFYDHVSTESMDGWMLNELLLLLYLIALRLFCFHPLVYTYQFGKIQTILFRLRAFPCFCQSFHCHKAFKVIPPIQVLWWYCHLVADCSFISLHPVITL